MRRILLLAAVLGFALLARPISAPLSLATSHGHGPVVSVHGPQEPCNSAPTPC